MDLVSIVIPVYNTGEPLRACLDSVVNQTYSNLEIIVVDDHSTDPLTLETLQEFAQKDSRIKIIVNQENYGLAKTRNVGTSHVSGEYITFLDSDDLFVPDFVERMYQAISVNKTDFVVCNVHNFTSDNSIPMEHDLIFPLDDAAKVNTSEFIHSDKFMKLPICAYAKLINVKHYLDKKIFFRDEMRYAEDHDWSYRLFCQMDSFSVLNFYGVNRLLRSGSLTHDLTGQSLVYDLEALVLKKNILREYKIFDKHIEGFLYICFQHIYLAFTNNKDPVYTQKLSEVCASLFKELRVSLVYPPTKFDVLFAFLNYKFFKILRMKKHKIVYKAIYKYYLKLRESL